VPNAVSSYSSSAPASRTTRTNLITNPSFEVDTAGWSVVGTAGTISRNTTDGIVGSSSAKNTVTGTGSAGVMTYFVGLVEGITPGITYTFSAYIKSSVSRSTIIYMNFLDASNNLSGQAQSIPTWSSTSAWTRISTTLIAPATTVKLHTYVGFLGALAGETHSMDAALLEVSSTLNPYFDGTNYSSIPEAYPSSILTTWTGTANASTSTISYYKQSDVKVGQLWVDSDDRSLYVYNGAEWVIAAAATATIPSINLNSNVIAADYTMPVGYNGTSAGPITVNSGVTVTIPSGSVWTVV
jgi:phage-related protein